MRTPQSAYLSAYLGEFRGPLEAIVRWLMFLWLFQALLTLLSVDAFDDLLVRVVPVMVFVILMVGAYQLVRRNPVAFFTPLPIFLAWSAVVFGIGPSYQWFTPDTANRVSSSIFPTDVRAYAEVALLNTSGLLLTIVGLLIMMQLKFSRPSIEHTFLPHNRPLLPIAAPDLRQLFATRQLLQVAYIALLFSIVLRFVEYGLNVQLGIPGFLSIIKHAGGLAVLVLAFVGARGSGTALVVAAAVALAEGAIGSSIGIRTEAITPLMLFFVGYYIGSRSLKGLVVGTLVVSGALLFITPVVKEIRQQTWSGGYTGGNMSALSEAYALQMREDEGDVAAGYQVWNRLDYSPWQAAMMDLYKMGAEGTTYRYIFWAFVPRFIAPDKPHFEVGTDIGYAVQGVVGSSSFSGTVYGEMYWNGGWSAVILSSIIYGILLGAVTAGSLWLFMQATMPAMLIGISGVLYGFVLDETFSVSVVGQGVIFILLLTLYRQGMHLFHRRSTQINGL